MNDLPFSSQASLSETTTCNHQFSEFERWEFDNCELCYLCPCFGKTGKMGNGVSPHKTPLLIYESGYPPNDEPFD